MKVKRFVVNLINVIIHLLIGGGLLYLWLPFCQWYYYFRPILGVDFYYFTTYVNYLTRHFSFRFNGWKYIWSAGYPLSLDYPTFHAYFVLPLTNFFVSQQAVQVYMLGSCFMFIFFSYLVFYSLSKNLILSLILAFASSMSIGVYGALIWGGSLPYFATQFFLPLIIYLLINFFNSGNKRWFFLSSLGMGLSILGHPQVALSYSFPIIFILLFFYPYPQEKYFSLHKFKKIFIYLLLALMISFPVLRLYLGQTSSSLLINSIFNIPKQLMQKIKLSAEISIEDYLQVQALETLPSEPIITTVSDFNKQQFNRLETDTNPVFFTLAKISCLIFIITFLLRRRKIDSLKAVVFTLPAIWVVSYIYLFSLGISLFHGGWYRVFWAFPLSLGMVISYIWGDFRLTIRDKMSKFKQNRVMSFSLSVFLGILALGFSLPIFKKDAYPNFINQFDRILYRQQSSAFPDALNVEIEKDKQDNLKNRLIPSWLDINIFQYRLYEADQRVNIWWNSFFDLPLVKGYADDPSGDSSGIFYWTSIALTQSSGKDNLVQSWGTPKSIAYNNAFFLTDWLSIKYFEAEHERSDSYNPLTSYLIEADIFKHQEKMIIPGWAQLYQTENEKIVYHKDVEEFLTYYELKDDLVSPIYHPTNASLIGVISDWYGYNTIVRNLAALNFNSKKVIPLQLGNNLDKVSQDTLKQMDLVILYGYNFRRPQGSWKKLDKYVQEGGKLFIETGNEVKETKADNLPSVFPINATKREEIGKKWELTSLSREGQGIDVNQFGRIININEPWFFSLPKSNTDLRENSQVILQSKDNPLIVARDYGKGKVIWSGMNLFHHFSSSKNLEEAKFMEKIITSLIPISDSVEKEFQVKKDSPQKITILGSNAKGVVFNEQAYPGWQAKIKSSNQSQKLRIFKSGPIAPGFQFVIIPEKFRDKEFEVTFRYRGNWQFYFWQLLSFIGIGIVIEQALFKGRFLTKIVYKPINKRVKSWWEKEEEY